MKKIFILLLNVLLVFTLFSCGLSGGNTIKPVSSPDFEEYEKKTLTIMSNAGIEVLDHGKVESQNKDQQDIISLMNEGLFLDQKQEIVDLTLKAPDLKPIKNNLTILDAIEQITYASLVNGYCLSQFYGETAFYDIVIHTPQDQYIMHTKEGNKTYCYIYNPVNEFREEEYCTVFEMDYKNDKDYVYSAIEFNKSMRHLVYFYGDNNLENIFVERNTINGKDAGSVHYNAPGYSNKCVTFDLETADKIFAKIGGEFNGFSLDEISKIKDRVNYNVSLENYDASLDYYFPRRKPEPLSKVTYHYSDPDQTILSTIYYNYPDQVDEVVVIPDDVTALDSDFRIIVSGEGIKELKIPKSVTTIYGQNKDGELEEVPVNKFRIIIENINKNEDNKNPDDKEEFWNRYRFFSKFTVDKENPIFTTSKNGHLMDKNNNYIVYINAPLEDGSFNTIINGKYDEIDQLVELPQKQFNVLFESVKAINYIITDFSRTVQIRVEDRNRFPNYNTVNVKVEFDGKYDPMNQIEVDIYVNRDVNVNLYGDYIYSVTQQPTQNHAKMTVNLKDNGYVRVYTFDGQIEVNAPFTQEKDILPEKIGDYNEIRHIEYNKDQDVTVNYAPSDKELYLDAVEYNFYGETTNINGEEIPFVVASIKNDIYKSITIPAYIDKYPVLHVSFLTKIEKLTNLVLPELVSKLEIYRDSLEKDDLLVEILNPKFEDKDIYCDFDQTYRFDVKIGDKTHTVSNCVLLTIKFENKEYKTTLKKFIDGDYINISSSMFEQIPFELNQLYIINQEGVEEEKQFTVFEKEWSFYIDNKDKSINKTVYITKFERKMNIYINEEKVATYVSGPIYVKIETRNSTTLYVELGEKGNDIQYYNIDLTKYGINTSVSCLDEFYLDPNSKDDYNIYLKCSNNELVRLKKANIYINDTYVKSLYSRDGLDFYANNSTLLDIKYSQDYSGDKLTDSIDLTQYGISSLQNYGRYICMSYNDNDIKIKADNLGIDIYKQVVIKINNEIIGEYNLPINNRNILFEANNSTTLLVKFNGEVLAEYDLKKKGITNDPVKFHETRMISNNTEKSIINQDIYVPKKIDSKIIINGHEFKFVSYKNTEVKLIAINSTTLLVDSRFNDIKIDLTKIGITTPINYDKFLSDFDLTICDYQINLTIDNATGEVKEN